MPANRFELSPLQIKIAIAASVVVFGLLAVYGLEQVNRQIQLERRLSTDPRLSRWYNHVSNQVSENTRLLGSGQHKEDFSSQKLARALWYGKVAESKDSKRTGQVLLVTLGETELLAGREGKRDGSDAVHISVRDHRFGGHQPKIGEEWVFSVWRDGEDNNFVHSAAFHR